MSSSDVSTHVETVCLLSKISETKNHISVKVDMDENGCDGDGEGGQPVAGDVNPLRKVLLVT